MSSMSAAQLNTLAEKLSGSLVLPTSSAYDAARQFRKPEFDVIRPAAIARVASTDDVGHVLRAAAETDTPVAVRSGGHTFSGAHLSDGAIVLDTRALRAVTIDPAARIARTGGGATAREYTTAVGAHGLATGFGDTGSVGVAGITVAGGAGFLVRRDGLTIDNLLAAELVTADGQVRHLDAETNPDLFWAVRGGGEGFGVVTHMTFRLHPAQQILGGMLLMPATPHVVAGLVAEAAAAPVELSIIVNVMQAPPLPMLPEEVHGKLITMVLLAYTGSEEEGNRALAPMRALATPLADMVSPMPYAGLFPEEEAGEEFRPRAFGQNLFTDRFGETEAEEAIAHIESSNADFAVTQLRPLGGAVQHTAAEETAYAHRHRPIMINTGIARGTSEEDEQRLNWIASLADALRHGEKGAYRGFFNGKVGDTIEEVYPGAVGERLRRIKAEVDPDGRFPSALS